MKEAYILIAIIIIFVTFWFLFFDFNSGWRSTPREIIKTEKNEEDKEAINTMVTLHTNFGAISILLFTKESPITAGNFYSLAQSGFYDGTKIHRVIPGFIIQGGDPNSKSDTTALYGTGGPGYTIKDEFIEGLSNVRGTLSMANAGPSTGGSQFFINLTDNTGLDYDKEPLTSKHPVFGKVISGMDIVEAISRAETGAGDIPLSPVIIESVSVE
ncbi:MAG: peptidylprolyl isomerase [Candidatus Paceibacterota bacterium]